MKERALQKLPLDARNSLWKIVRTSINDRIQDPPVTWFRIFGDDPSLSHSNDLTNPFAQDDHIPPTYQELYPRRQKQ